MIAEPLRSRIKLDTPWLSRCLGAAAEHVHTLFIVSRTGGCLNCEMSTAPEGRVVLLQSDNSGIQDCNIRMFWFGTARRWNHEAYLAWQLRQRALQDKHFRRSSLCATIRCR